MCIVTYIITFVALAVLSKLIVHANNDAHIYSATVTVSCIVLFDLVCGDRMGCWVYRYI